MNTYPVYPWVDYISPSQPPLDTGRHVSLAMDGDIPHIAYYNVTSSTLEYAKYVQVFLPLVLKNSP